MGHYTALHSCIFGPWMIKQHALQTTALGPGFCFRSMGVSSKSFQTSGIITAALILFVFCWFCWFRNTTWAFSHAGLKFKVMEIPFWKTLDFFFNFSLFVWMITSKIWEQGVGLQVLSLLSASLGLSYIWAVAAFTVCPHSPLRSAPYFFYSFVFCVQAVRKRALKWKRSHFYARHGLGKKWTSNPNSSSPFGTRSRRWMRRSVGRCPSLSWRYEMKFRVQKTKIRKNFRTDRTWTCNCAFVLR